jgi:FtsP/CotA-like multicopper oxidase with cupredoxin domain
VRAARALLATAGAALILSAVGWLAWSWQQSRLPGTYNVMQFGTMDYGGTAVPAARARTISVADLRGPLGAPDVRFSLTAEHATVRLSSGRTIDALTFNGRSPGPELRVHRGDLVEVTLANKDVEEGVTIHWHGVDVPNAEDGVAGVTQDAVLPGKTYTYSFRADQVGTFWYHTHQASADGVERGLFGALVILPDRSAAEQGLDLALVAHDFDGAEALNSADATARRAVAPGTPVRLRLINSDSTPLRFAVDGTPFRVVAIDGTDLNRPPPLANVPLELAAGGRYDIAFTMPSTPVGVTVVDTPARLVLSRDGKADGPPPAAPQGSVFDPLTYGTPAPTPFGARSRFDRQFTFTIGRKLGFYDGNPGFQWTINGGIYPDVPMFVVRRGDLVKVTIANKTKAVHPMHLHGHHLLVLSRDGVASSGSPWWADTLELRPGDRYEVAFRADNPGIWMDHCHNLGHAVQGLTMHFMYAGVGTPFQVGGAAHNQPE